MDKNKNKNLLKIRRHARVRAKISGTTLRPRLTVFRSLKHISVQVIDDTKGKTLCSASDKEAAGKSPMEKAAMVGKMIAEKTLAQKISSVVFDKGAFKFHGRVKALADGAKEAGLKI